MPLDLYCERIAPGLFGEPVNTLSNLAFILAAWASWRVIRGREPRGSLRLLVVLIFGIAIGSTVFHMVAEFWAQILDVTPIFLFQVVWVWLYAREVTRLKRPQTMALLTVFLVLALTGSQLRQFLNGALPYAPALVVLGLFGVHHRRHQPAAPNDLLIALLCFIGALFFRIIDLAVCESIPFGTHFLWHVLNGAVIFYSMKALALNLPRIEGHAVSG